MIVISPQSFWHSPMTINMHWLQGNGGAIGVYGFIYLQTLAKGHGRIMARATGVTCRPSKKKKKTQLGIKAKTSRTANRHTVPPLSFSTLCSDESGLCIPRVQEASHLFFRLENRPIHTTLGPRPAQDAANKQFGSGWMQRVSSRLTAGPVYLFRGLGCCLLALWKVIDTACNRFVTSTTPNKGLPA